MKFDVRDRWPQRKSVAEPLRLEYSTVMTEWIVRLGVDETAIYAAAARAGRMPAALETYFGSLAAVRSRPVLPERQAELELRFADRKKRLLSR